MNIVRVVRLREEEREEYVRASLSEMKVQTLRKYMKASGVNNSDQMRKEEMINELTHVICKWADTQELQEVLNRRI